MMNRIASFLIAFCLAAITGCAAPLVARPAPASTVAPVQYVVVPANMAGTMGVPAMAAIPQNVASINAPPPGCEVGPLAMTIHNGTDKFVQLSLDGEQIQILGSGGALPPYLPPGAQVYLCLARTGTHTVRGETYLNRMGMMQKDAGPRHRFQWVFTPAQSKTEFDINPATFYGGVGGLDG